MVFFNYATMQMAAKIVYYGPGLCGKTTNLHYIYAKTSPQSRGEMVSLETETDRTLFFDLLPIDVGVIGGFKTRLQLYTIPGQVFYNMTRKLVLKGVDGIVFVADSQRAMLEANAESFRNLQENLKEIGLTLDEIPLVVQLNKRDLPNIADAATILRLIDPDGRFESAESSAVTGQGVFETLKLISKLTLRTLRRRMMGDDSAKAAPIRRPVLSVQGEPPASPARAPGSSGSGTQPIPIQPQSAPHLAASAKAQPGRAATAAMPVIATPPEELREAASAPAPSGRPPVDMPFSDVTDYPREIRDRVPGSGAPDSPAPVVLPVALEAEPEVDFSQTDVPVNAPVIEEVKHVKVRSSVDIMAELESLRKKATQTPIRSRRESQAALDTLASFRPKKELKGAITLRPSGVAGPTARKLRVSVTLEGPAGLAAAEEQTFELDSSAELQNLQFNLKIDFGQSQ